MLLARLGAGVAGALLIVGRTDAQPAPSPSITSPPAAAVGLAASPDILDSLVVRALDANPAVRAAVARVDAARARVAPAGARPDPMLMAGVQNLPISDPGFADEMTMAMVGVGQTIVGPGKRDLRRRAAERDVEAARATLARTRLEVARGVRVAYYDLAYLDRALTIVERNRRVLLDLVRAAEARYGSGASAAPPSRAGMLSGTQRPMAGPGSGGMPATARAMPPSTAGGMGIGSTMIGGMGAGPASTAMAAPPARTGESAVAGSASMPGPGAGTAPMGTSIGAMSGSSLQEVIRARVDLARLGEDASALLEERRATLARLNAALGRASQTPVDSASVPSRLVRAAVADSATGVRFVSATLGARAADSPLPDVATLQDLAVRRSPALRAHEASIGAQSVRVALARRERRPDVDVAVQYGVRPRHADMVTAIVSVPLPIQRRRVQDQIVVGAGAELAALEAEHHEEVNRLHAEVARLHAEAERARTQLALLKAAVLPTANAALAAGIATYAAGRSDVGSILDARAGLFNQETAYWRALTDFAKAVAELELVAGGEVLP